MSRVIRCDGGCGAERDPWDGERWEYISLELTGLDKEYDLCPLCAAIFKRNLPPYPQKEK